MPVDRSPVPCPYCERNCAGGTGLSAHVRTNHPGKRVPTAQEIRQGTFVGGAEAPSPTVALPERVPTGPHLVWEAPPARSSSFDPLGYRAFVAELKRNPGRWARIETFARPTSAATRVPKCKEAFPDVEWKSARLPNGGSAIYARYAGDD